MAAVAKAPSRELPTIPPIDLNGELEKALNQVVPEEMNDFESIQVSAADIIKQDMEFPSTLPKKKAIKPSPELISPSIVSEEEPVPGKNKANLAESEIPVLTAKKSEKAEGDSSSTYWRAGLSLAIVLIFAGALIFGAKHWTRNRLGVQSQTKIRMLTQHHLGPKKSLAIVQVAGESILIGVTDHSINLIKTLSLLDEEIPEETPSSFSGELNRVSPEVQEPEVQDRVNLQAKAEVTKSVEEEFSYGRIQSQVADRLKEMRSL